MPALTSLRFVAAFAVLLLHFRDLLGPMPAWLRQGIVGGQYGVTFFVLSGFILTYRYHGWFSARVSDAGFWQFQRLRMARIYPVYVLGLLLDTPWHLIERAHAGNSRRSGRRTGRRGCSIWWACRPGFRRCPSRCSGTRWPGVWRPSSFSTPPFHGCACC